MNDWQKGFKICEGIRPGVLVIFGIFKQAMAEGDLSAGELAAALAEGDTGVSSLLAVIEESAAPAPHEFTSFVENFGSLLLVED